MSNGHMQGRSGRGVEEHGRDRVVVQASTDDDEIDLRELFDLLKSGRWLIVACVVVALVLGIFYVTFARPVYQVSGLLQVDQNSQTSGVMQSMGSFASLLAGGTLVTDAEIQIIKSRLVLTPAIDKLNLLVSASPHYFPFVGYTIAHWFSPDKKGDVAGAPPFLGSYAWGGESISVAEFEPPVADHNKAFTLKAKGGNAYTLIGPEDNTVLEGVVGKPASGKSKNGTVHILVRSLVARPGETFNVVRYARQTMLKSVSSRLSVAEQGKQSGVIQLSIQGHDRNAALTLVNAIENSYIAQDVAHNSEQAKHSLKFLEAQLPELRKKLDAAQDKLAAYQRKNGAADIASKTQLMLKKAVALDTEHSQLVQQREQALQRFTSQHPVVQGLDNQIGTVERQQAELKKSIANLPGTQQEVLDLMRNLDVNTQLYTTMLDAIQQYQVTKAGTIGNVRIVDYGMEPLQPVSPKKKLVLVLALVLGAFVGVGLVFLRRVMLRGADDPGQVEDLLGVNVLASVPQSKAQTRLARRARNNPASTHLLALEAGDDEAVEALRSLHTALRLSAEKPANNILMFTGPVPGIGKSFISINYAALLAMAGAKVALLDLDLRLGHLGDYLKLSNDHGLHEVLEGQDTLAAVCHSTPVPGLDFYARGKRAQHPAELLMAPVLETILADLAARYDHVVIDAPPVLAVTDPTILGQHAGTTLLVLEAARHPMREIEESNKRLMTAQVNVRGAVFNRVGAKAGSYGYGGYGYGYNNYSYKKGG